MYLTLVVLVGWVLVALFLIPELVAVFIEERGERDRPADPVAPREPVRMAADTRGDG